MTRGERIVVGIILLIAGVATEFFGLAQFITNIVLFIGIAVIMSSFFILIKQYQRAVILRLGHYDRTVGAGLRVAIPFYDDVDVLDVRERVVAFQAESMLTKDNVPVTIDAILRYKVIAESAKDAILNVDDFREMISQISQTALRNNIGSSVFQDLLSKREEINTHIKQVMEKEATGWGVEVTGVEIRQVSIPGALEAAMSMQAQAEREKSARITYGESEVAVAQQFQEASKVYADNPVAYALRQSNMLYESMKVQGNTIVMVPTESLNSMGFGNLATTIAYLENTKKAAKSQDPAPQAAPAPAAAAAAKNSDDENEDDQQ